MIPKKPKELIKEYAAKVEIPLQDMANMVEEYYRQIRLNASGLKHWNIRIRGLGDLRSSFKKVSKDYFKYVTQKTKFRKDKESKEYKEAVSKLEQLAPLMQIFKEERKKEEIVKEKKRKFFIEKAKIKRQNK